jgi:hypothetical protein
LVTEVTEGKGSGVFLFRDIPVLGTPFRPAQPMEELFTGGWERAGYAQIYIGKPGA